MVDEQKDPKKDQNPAGQNDQNQDPNLDPATGKPREATPEELKKNEGEDQNKNLPRQ